jgi:phage N-6-adenine-methyltransferase
MSAGPKYPTCVHFSSASDDWETPQDFFDAQDKVHGFTLDVCADNRNAKCGLYFTKRVDGLSRPWAPHKCWMNPPYGREIGKWMRKAYEESQSGATVVCLVPARTDTAWWHNYAAKGDVTFIRGRLKFVGGKHGAPFPSAVIVLSPPRS